MAPPAGPKEDAPENKGGKNVMVRRTSSKIIKETWTPRDGHDIARVVDASERHEHIESGSRSVHSIVNNSRMKQRASQNKFQRALSRRSNESYVSPRKDRLEQLVENLKRENERLRNRLHEDHMG